MGHTTCVPSATRSLMPCPSSVVDSCWPACSGDRPCRRHLRQMLHYLSIRTTGLFSVPMGMTNRGDGTMMGVDVTPGVSKAIGVSVTSGGGRTHGDTGTTARPDDQGMACPIATRFIEARSASCAASASAAPATIAAANTGANVNDFESLARRQPWRGQPSPHQPALCSVQIRIGRPWTSPPPPSVERPLLFSWASGLVTRG